VLGVALGVVAAAAVTDRDVQVPVGTELELTAVVVALVGWGIVSSTCSVVGLAESRPASAVNSLTRSSQPELGQVVSV
jgi:hypothetical protein